MDLLVELAATGRIGDAQDQLDELSTYFRYRKRDHVLLSNTGSLL
jgi:hypothetical protein